MSEHRHSQFRWLPWMVLRAIAFVFPVIQLLVALGFASVFWTEKNETQNAILGTWLAMSLIFPVLAVGSFFMWERWGKKMRNDPEEKAEMRAWMEGWLRDNPAEIGTTAHDPRP